MSPPDDVLAELRASHVQSLRYTPGRGHCTHHPSEVFEQPRVVDALRRLPDPPATGWVLGHPLGDQEPVHGDWQKRRLELVDELVRQRRLPYTTGTSDAYQNHVSVIRVLLRCPSRGVLAAVRCPLREVPTADDLLHRPLLRSSGAIANGPTFAAAATAPLPAATTAASRPPAGRPRPRAALLRAWGGPLLRGVLGLRSEPRHQAQTASPTTVCFAAAPAFAGTPAGVGLGTRPQCYATHGTPAT
mmetsp:Transcript_113763/g.361538  ORF Transcript_113763/g.361538 Transcript_113763/m.361538 type:complete len:245 (+) Transcript_113763:462-1196(+)